MKLVFILLLVVTGRLFATDLRPSQVAGHSEGTPFIDDTWAPTSTTNAPVDRQWQTAVWTGSEMIVWGGFHFVGFVNTGGKYRPITNSWTATSITNAPSARYGHSAVWTGSQMIVWGREWLRRLLEQWGEIQCQQ